MKHNMMLFANVTACLQAIWSYFTSTYYYHHFVGHCGAFFGLKWRIWRAKMYFSPLK